MIDFKNKNFELKLTTLTLSGQEFYNSVPDSYLSNGGVYVLRCIHTDTKSPYVIPRCTGDELLGILYIGKGSKFPHRTGDLARTIDSSYQQNKHGAGVTYNSNVALQRAFPKENLWVSFFISDKPEELEAEFLSSYFDKIGEVPPLNSQS